MQTWNRPVLAFAICCIAAGAIPALSPTQADAAYPGANGRIAFDRSDGGPWEIWTINPDGSDPVNLGPGVEPSWSPDGTKIAYMFFDGSQADIWVMNADGSGKADLTQTPSQNELLPKWFPDGAHIAYTHDYSNGVYAIPSGGGSSVALGIGADSYSISPDGKHIAFSPPQSYRDIYTADVPSPPGPVTNVTNLTSSPSVNDLNPAWSPDGSRIAFISSQNYGDQLWAMNADGSNPTLISGHGDEYVDWSPDGTKFATSSVAGNGPVYVMNSDGSERNVITDPITDCNGNHSGGYGPVWQPAASPPVHSPYQPDGQVKPASGANFVGQGIYDDSSYGQVAKKRIYPGKTATFIFRSENAGSVVDSMLIHGCPSASGFITHYFADGNDVTSQVVNGSLSFDDLPSGSAGGLKITIKARRKDTFGLGYGDWLTASSVSKANEIDVVETLVRVR